MPSRPPGFTSACCHQDHPRRPFGSTWLVEVVEFAQVMGLQPFSCLAELTLSGQEPMDQLVMPGGHDRLPVGQVGGAFASQRDPSEAGDQ
jgi:hypothetical protein